MTDPSKGSVPRAITLKAWGFVQKNGRLAPYISPNKADAMECVSDSEKVVRVEVRTIKREV